ncbi:arylamine N-acetyltransferase family protein [Nocardia thraciensis]
MRSLTPATHALARVTAADDDRVWLCDVGFGAGPLEPLELNSDRGEVKAGEWRLRVERARGELDSELWAVHHFARDGWVARYTFTTNPQYRIDYVVGNHFVSTSPRSPFVTRPYVQRFLPEVHHVIDGTTWMSEYPDGSAQSRELEPSELPKTLAEVFAIELDDADIATLVASPALYH